MSPLSRQRPNSTENQYAVASLPHERKGTDTHQAKSVTHQSQRRCGRRVPFEASKISLHSKAKRKVFLGGVWGEGQGSGKTQWHPPLDFEIRGSNRGEANALRQGGKRRVRKHWHVPAELVQHVWLWSVERPAMVADVLRAVEDFEGEAI
jgi:hypothetical protein